MLSSCEKNPAVNENIYTQISPLNLIDPSNSDNPYDYYGSLHNEGLRMALDNIKKLPDYSFEECVKIASKAAENVLCKEGFIFSKSNNIEDDEELVEMIKFIVDDMENNFSNLIESLSLTSDTKEHLKILFNDVIEMDETDELFYENAYDRLVDFETKVLNNIISIPINEREVVLGSTSTFRYSLAFWIEEIDEIDIEDLELRKGWHLIAIFDFIGFFVGGPQIAIISSAIAAIYVVFNWIKGLFNKDAFLYNSSFQEYFFFYSPITHYGYNIIKC